MLSRLLPALLVLGSACQSSPPPERAPTDLSSWRSEEITLPPAFAPEMPKGREVLLFSPGMFNAEAEDHWSYVFLMDIEEQGVSKARLEEVIELYFDGIIGLVGSGKSLNLPADPATVKFEAGRDNRYRGIVNTFDAFGDGQAIELNVRAHVQEQSDGRTLIEFQASPKTPGKDPIWWALDDALESLEFS